MCLACPILDYLNTLDSRNNFDLRKRWLVSSPRKLNGILRAREPGGGILAGSLLTTEAVFLVVGARLLEIYSMLTVHGGSYLIRAFCLLAFLPSNAISMVAIWACLYLSAFVLPAYAQRPPKDETCDPEWFGRPTNQDCKNALAKLPDWEAITGHGSADWGSVREFTNVGWPTIPTPNNDETYVRTPLIYTSGGWNIRRIIVSGNLI